MANACSYASIGEDASILYIQSFIGKATKLAKHRWRLPDIRADSALWRSFSTTKLHEPDYYHIFHNCSDRSRTRRVHVNDGKGDFKSCMFDSLSYQKDESFFLSASANFKPSTLAKIDKPLIMALSGSHDSSIAFMRGSNIVLAVELERISAQRYYEMLDLQNTGVVQCARLAFHCNSVDGLSNANATVNNDAKFLDMCGHPHPKRPPALRVLRIATEIAITQFRTKMGINISSTQPFDLGVVLDSRLIPVSELVVPLKSWLYERMVNACLMLI